MEDPRPLSSILGTEAIELCMAVRDNEDARKVKAAATSAINQGLDEKFAFINAEYEQGKAGIIAKMQDAGIDIPSNASLVQVYNMLDELLILSANGVKLKDGVSIPNRLSDAITNYKSIIEEVEINLESIPDDLFNSSSVLKRVVLNNATNLNSRSQQHGCFVNCTNLISIVAPKVTSWSLYNVNRESFFTECYNIRNIYMPSLSSASILSSNYNYQSYNALRHLTVKNQQIPTSWNLVMTMNSVYDFNLTEVIIGNYVNAHYGSGTAISATSNSLCNHDEWDDPNEPAVGFENNLQKFLWYFEYHFIPCFGTVTTSPTLTLNANCYNAISAAYSIEQPTKTLKDLLTDKGWNVASA